MTENRSTSQFDQRTALELSFDARGNVRVTVEAFSDDLNHDFTDGLVELVQQGASLLRTSASETAPVSRAPDVREPSPQFDRTRRDRAERLHRARLAARWIRMYRHQFSTPQEAMRAVAEQFGQSPGDFEALIRFHRKRAKQRLGRFRDRKMINLYSSGHTYAQIGKQFGCTSKTVSTRVKRAMANNGTDVKSSASETRNLSTSHFQNGS